MAVIRKFQITERAYEVFYAMIFLNLQWLDTAMTDTIDVKALKKILADFAKARDWEKFHNPKNLAMAIAGEAGELVELFQWLTAEEASHIKNQEDAKERVSHELADILLYVIRLADQLDINLNTALLNKININNEKYPAEKVKGSAKKYHEYSIHD